VPYDLQRSLWGLPPYRYSPVLGEYKGEGVHCGSLHQYTFGKAGKGLSLKFIMHCYFAFIVNFNFFCGGDHSCTKIWQSFA